MLEQYLKDLFNTSKNGDATEASYYTDLKNLLIKFLSEKGFDPSITIQPKRQEVGIPDFTVRKGRELIGYMEAKDPKYENLDNLPERDQKQIKRYKEKLPNLIITNFLDFWLFRDGKKIKQVRIGMPSILNQVKAPPPPQNLEQLKELFNLFFAYYIPEKRTPKALAEELAKRAQLLPQSIIEELNNDKETEIDRIYNAFKEYLMSDLTPEGFADIYAQTLTYGLFTARLNYPNTDFDRKKAGDYIPKSIKILRDTFNLISSDAIPESLESYVDDIATILAHADINKIKGQLKNKTGESDPLIHFYETFLGEYDPKKRKSLGVYFTPLPVVSYITRSINQLLKDRFHTKDGLANTSLVTLLDPASGTLTFLAESIKRAVGEQQLYSQSVSSLKKHFLNHFFAFEILMAPYIIGHLRMALLFEELKIPLNEQDRFPLYLTNSLDFSNIHQSNLPFVADLAKEAEEARKVKNKDILVILGNPPYTSEKKEKGVLPEWIKEKLQDYTRGLGVEKEKKKGVLQDDYIRFIRFAHWKIDQYGKGMVAFITNNSYLDGIIHRSMRKQLLDSFDEIYILNLHGNSRVKEKTPDGGIDENVFDIQQGVSVSIFVKTGEGKKKKIYYKDLWGTRKEKYKYLNNAVCIEGLEEIKPQSNEFYFAKKDYSLKAEWDSWLSLDEIFSKYVSGIETKRDRLVIDFDNQVLSSRIHSFLNSVGDDEFIMKSFDLSEKSDLNIHKAKLRLKGLNINENIVEFSYRPFDTRWLFYDESLVSRTRKPLMLSLSNKNINNIALNTTRQLKADHQFAHALVTNHPSDRILLSNTTSEASYIFPLIASQTEEAQVGLFDQSMPSSNFTHNFWKWFDQNSLGSTVPGDTIFYYIYAILYAHNYREKYLGFLKSDFPHIPFTKDDKLFFKLSKLGIELADLHLLKSDKLDDPFVKLYGEGNGIVERREWENNKVWINKTQYFAPIKKEIWEYYIGGYQVVDKWLKDRIGRELLQEEIKCYCQIILVFAKTIEIQKQIDELYPKVEETL